MIKDVDQKFVDAAIEEVKNVTAGNLMHLFVGSEGILGVVTEATVRLLAQPQEVRTALVVFPHLDDASVAADDALDDARDAADDAAEAADEAIRDATGDDELLAARPG